MNGCLVTQYVHMTHFLAKELAFKSDVSMPWQDYIPLKKINLLSEFADMNVEESEVYFIMLLLSRFSRVRLCATPETAAHQAPPSMGFSRQEYWSGVHCLLQESGIARRKLLSWSVYFEKGGKPQVETQMPIYIHMRQEAQALEDS